jgi:GNAT superfamily N-acetyltransferase
VILSALHPAFAPPAADTGPERRSATLDLVRSLYPHAPHATLCMPFSKLKPELSRCHYLASTNGSRLGAVVAYTREAVEFTWCRPECTEALRNLISHVRHRVPAIKFLPMIESDRLDWGALLGLERRGRFFRGLLSEKARFRCEVPPGYEIEPFDPQTDLRAAAELFAACEPDAAGRPGIERLRGLTAAADFFAHGWFFLRERSSGRRIGLAVNGYCPEFQEGFVDWVQVLPEVRHHGLGTVLLCESLRRMQHARFVTVAGALDAARRGGDIFTRCGFDQMHHWTILAQAAAPAP